MVHVTAMCAGLPDLSDAFARNAGSDDVGV